MEIPALNKNDIDNALLYIDKNGVPDKYQSTKYDIFLEGKTYPIKYVIAVANSLANNIDISTADFNSIEAKRFLEKLGYEIKNKKEKEFVLTITKDNIISSDERFTMNNLSLGDKYKPTDAYFENANGIIIRRKREKGERVIGNKTLPRLAFQIFEKEIDSLSKEEKESFPTCKYKPNGKLYSGIFSSIKEFKQHYDTIEHLAYKGDNNKEFVIYCWNIFSTLIFVQECLKRFGSAGDKFILLYIEETKKESIPEEPNTDQNDLIKKEEISYKNSFSPKLLVSKNIIFRGAPGTGKSYLAKEIASDIVSDGRISKYEELSEEEKMQIEFVQFHPSYDYTDFVEGLRPINNEDGSMSFELRDGIFKRFITRAKKNYEDSKKSEEKIAIEQSVQDSISDFFSDMDMAANTFQIATGNEFTITNVDDDFIRISIPKNSVSRHLNLNLDDIRKMLESEQRFEQVKDITKFFGKKNATQSYSYYLAIYKSIYKFRRNHKSTRGVNQNKLKQYIFIIDEINRGEISKIFGELFFSIDPSYRGETGAVSTQYTNLHPNLEDKFYIPENVYIIGTMNDIDRSVDSFDFAMRRRFRFIELKANEQLAMLSNLDEEIAEEAKKRMIALNNEIANVEDLNENYQIGASYFLKLNDISFDLLWTDYLRPLLQDYIHGMYDEDGIMKRFEEAYGYKEPQEGLNNELSQNQG